LQDYKQHITGFVWPCPNSCAEIVSVSQYYRFCEDIQSTKQDTDTIRICGFKEGVFCFLKCFL